MSVINFRQIKVTHSYKELSIRIGLILAMLILSLLSISIGIKEFSLIGLIKGNISDAFIASISRVPRTLAIIITGAGLSMAGLIMQTITNNKFVSPTTAGTIEWCRCGVMFAILLMPGQSNLAKVSLAFIVSLIGTLLFMFILQKIPFKTSYMVPLIGIMLGNIVGSITTFFAYKYEIIQNMSSWLQGNFSLIVKGNYEILYIGIPFIVITYLYANKFTIAGMGESFATSLGLNHRKIIFLGLVIVAFITSLIVVTIGSIPFVGLIVPNIISFFKGDNLKGTLLDTALMGSVFLLICDILGRIIISPFEISVSVVVSILGSIIFLIILFTKNRK